MKLGARKTFVIFDGHALLHRGYHAIPPLLAKDGTPTNGVYGFTVMMLNALRELKPDYAAVAWDLPGPTFRHKMYSDYKGTRKKLDDELAAQIPVTSDLVETFAIPLVGVKGYEADDVIGTLAHKYKGEHEVVIVTGDMDELQLVDDHVKVFTLRKGFSDTIIYDKAAVREKYGLTPEEFIVFKALKGDTSDNIPGVSGIGDKTASDLVAKYKTLEAMYENLDELKPAVKAKLEAGREQAQMSLELSRIAIDAPIDFNMRDAALHEYDRNKVVDLFHKLGFKSLLNKLPNQKVSTNSAQRSLFDEDNMTEAPARSQHSHLASVNYICVDSEEKLDKLAEGLKRQKEFAFDIETDSIDVINANLVGMSFSWKEGEAYYVPVGHKKASGSLSQAISSSDSPVRTSRSTTTSHLRASDLPRTSSELENLAPGQLSLKTVLDKLKLILENPKIGKIGHNIKFDYQILRRYDITLGPIACDTMVAAFLINPVVRAQTLSNLAFSELGIEMIDIEELIGPRGKNQQTFDLTPIHEATKYAAEDADIAWRLYKSLDAQLSEIPTVREVGSMMEWPLIPVLAEAELTGVKLDVKFLVAFSHQINDKLAKLEDAIWEEAGEHFNINSTAQLKVILFDKLKIDGAGLKKNKTGLSTAAKELEKLRGTHPIIDHLFEYREVAKLKSTYVDTLPLLVNKTTGRIHTSYNQTIAQTGRLSSTNPNLQNIPIRTPLGREIRRAFIADKGKVFVSADYSQIELRLAAALADDKPMIEAFKSGADIHALTASEMFAVDIKDVTKEQRYAAKTINFGILYGMNPHGLSVATGMTYEEAKAFIDRYFEIRRGIADYIAKVKKEAHQQDYTETIFGRRRPCPEVHSNNFVVRSAAERAAVNMPLQGTAADMMKLAMIKLAAKLPEGARMILQIHDELIVECDEKLSSEVGDILKTTMEKIHKFAVPIEVGVCSGRGWGELE